MISVDIRKIFDTKIINAETIFLPSLHATRGLLTIFKVHNQEEQHFTKLLYDNTSAFSNRTLLFLFYVNIPISGKNFMHIVSLYNVWGSMLHIYAHVLW